LKEEGFDVIAANILSDTIVALLEEVKRVLSKEGLFICSGIIEENKNRVVEEMEAQGFEILEVGLKQEWVAIAGMLKEPGPNKIETDFTLHFS
jgi:ribosomal protein L11 methyltransferase